MAANASISLIHMDDIADISKRISIPQYPTGFNSEDELISVSFNSISGTFKDRPVCYKKKIIWVFDAISEASLNTMYYGLTGIIGRIKEHSSRFFRISSNIPGMPDGKYYLGTPSSFKFIGQSGSGNNVTRQYSGELHWIEVEGYKLNTYIE